MDMAFPCATQHELGHQDAQQLVDHGCKYVFEGESLLTCPAAATACKA